MAIKVLLLILFFIVTLCIGLYCRKHATDVGSFVLGSRNMGPWLTAFSYGTSYFSAVVFIGYAGQFGWNFGLSAFWIGIGNAVVGSLIAWAVLGRRTRIMTKHLDAATMPDFLAKRYQNGSLKIIVSVMIFIFLVPYSASVYKGLSGMFASAFGIDFTYCMIAMAILTGVYVIAGGYMAVALNDLLQGIIMIIGMIAVIIAVLSNKGGLMSAMEQLSSVPVEAVPNFNGALVSIFGPEPLNLLAVIILTSLGTWGLPQMVHKFYTIKNEKSIKTGMIISTVFALIIAGGSYFIGGFGRLFYTPGAAGIAFDEIMPTMMISTLSDLLLGIVIVMLLSASMSTLSALVIASSSTFTLDFLKGTLYKNMGEKHQVIIIKIFCGIFVLLSVVIALNPNNLITTLMSLSWGALAGAFLGPFLYGLFWKKTTLLSVFACFISGVGINVYNFINPYTAPTTAGAISIVLSLIIVPVVSLITPRPSKQHVDSVFSCYDEKVQVTKEHKYLLKENED